MKKVLFLLLGGGCQWLAGAEAAAGGTVRVQWFGQSFYQLTSSAGLSVVIDPFDNTFFDYPVPKGLTADILLVTHEHNDHKNIGIIGGSPLICRSEKGVGRFDRSGVSVVGTGAFHDENQGADRGRNTIYSFQLDGVRFCHLGDLGHLLSEEQVRSIGPVDVLFLPCGGFFTIDVGKLDRLVAQLKPRIVVPMHYKTPFTPKLPIAVVDKFLGGKTNVKRLGTDAFTIGAAGLPEQPEVRVLEIR